MPRSPLIESSPVPISEEAEQQIYQALFNGQKIQAIKVHRQATGFGLKESKEFIEVLEKQLHSESPEKFVARKGLGCTGVVVLAVGLGWSVMALV